MRKFFFLLISVSFISVAVHAEIFSWGVRAGVNISNAKVDLKDQSVSPGNMTKFQFGPMAEVGVGPIRLQTGAIFNQKGYGFNIDASYLSTIDPGLSALGSISGSFDVNYLEVPVNLLFRPKFFKVGFYIGGGPYWGFVAGGKYNVEVAGKTLLDGKVKDVAGSENSDWIEKKDFGANALAGLIVGPVRVGVNFGISLKDQVPATFSEAVPVTNLPVIPGVDYTQLLQQLDEEVSLKARNKAFSITVALMF